MEKSSKKYKPLSNYHVELESSSLSLSLAIGMAYIQKDGLRNHANKGELASIEFEALAPSCNYSVEAPNSRKDCTSQFKHTGGNPLNIGQSSLALCTDSSLKMYHGPASNILIENLINRLSVFYEDCGETEESDDCNSVDSIDLAKKRMKHPWHRR
jgi:hypothetical protein